MATQLLLYHATTTTTPLVSAVVLSEWSSCRDNNGSTQQQTAQPPNTLSRGLAWRRKNEMISKLRHLNKITPCCAQQECAWAFKIQKQISIKRSDLRSPFLLPAVWSWPDLWGTGSRLDVFLFVCFTVHSHTKLNQTIAIINTPKPAKVNTCSTRNNTRKHNNILRHIKLVFPHLLTCPQSLHLLPPGGGIKRVWGSEWVSQWRSE